jgi:hypothetical protein
MTPDLARFGRFFHILELPPFTLTGVAVSSALAGDWVGSHLVRSKVYKHDERLRPL